MKNGFLISLAAAVSLIVGTVNAQTIAPLSVPSFQPTPSYSQLSVTASSGRVSLPTGSVVAIYNTGSNAAYVQLGNSSVTATSSNDRISAGRSICLSVGTATYLAAIETTGLTALNISGGTGGCFGFGNGDSSATSWGGALLAPASPVGTQAPSGNVQTVNGDITGCSAPVCPPLGQTTASGSSPIVPASDVAGPVQGLVASGATDSDKPLNEGGRAATASPTAVTDGQKVAAMMTTTGKVVVQPFAPPALWVSGTNNNAATGSAVTLVTNPGSLSMYITDLQCMRTDAGSTALLGTVADSTPTTLGYISIPSGGAWAAPNVTPWSVAAGKNLTISFSLTTTVYCNARGYQGS